MRYRREREPVMRLRDLALKAGVSPTTVSNVLNGRRERMSAATFARVQRILEETGYVSHMAPRILSGNGSRVIGVLVGGGLGSTSGQRQYGRLLCDLEQELFRRNYQMLPHSSMSVEEHLRVAQEWNVEGLIVLGLRPEGIRKLKVESQVPVVSVDAYYEGEQPVVNVGADDLAGGYLMGRYLLDMGHRKIRFLAESNMGVEYFRWKGLEKACAEVEILLEKNARILIPRQRKRREQFYKKRLAALACENDALFFSTDYFAAEAAGYLWDMGFKVPEQISVAGFDDDECALLGRPRLTTVRLDQRLKARLAAETLLERIRGVQDGCSVRLPVQLVVRDSVARKEECAY